MRPEIEALKGGLSVRDYAQLKSGNRADRWLSVPVPVYSRPKEKPPKLKKVALVFMGSS